MSAARFVRSIPPVTRFVLASCAATFLVQFFAQRAVFGFLLFEPMLALARPWTFLTFPLVAPPGLLRVLLSGFVFAWVGGDLERRWGSREFGLFLAAIAVLFGVSFWSAALVTPSMPLGGLDYPLGAVFLAWCMLHPESPVLLMFVLPVPARILGYVSLGLVYFGTGPVLGLFALLPPLAAWWYAVRGRRLRMAWRSAADAPRRPRRPWSETLNPLAWYRRRKRRREFEAMALRMGLVDRARNESDRGDTIN